MKKFCRYKLIGGGTLCLIKKRGETLDLFVSNSANEIFYLTMWHLDLISYRLSKKRRHRQGTWKKLVKRDGRKCKFCGFSEGILTIDHIIPISKGGHHKSLSNLQILCYECNQNKGDKLE